MYGKVWNRVNIGTDSNTVNHLVYQLRPCTMYMTLNARTLSIRVKSNFEMQLLLLTNLVEDISVTAPRSENEKRWFKAEPYILDVLCRQPIKLFQVVSTSEFHEY